MDARGRPIKGVTAVSVKEILPMHQAELLKLCMVVNDDDLDKVTMDAEEQRKESMDTFCTRLRTKMETSGRAFTPSRLKRRFPMQ